MRSFWDMPADGSSPFAFTNAFEPADDTIALKWRSSSSPKLLLDLRRKLAEARAFGAEQQQEQQTTAKLLRRAQFDICVQREVNAEHRHQVEKRHQAALFQNDWEFKRNLRVVQCKLEAAQAQLVAYRDEAKQAEEDCKDMSKLLHTSTQALQAANNRAARLKADSDVAEDLNKGLWAAAAKSRERLLMVENPL